MDRGNFECCYLLLLITFVPIYGAEKNFVSADTNVVAIARSVATLNCSNSSLLASSTARWHYSYYGRTTPVCIYNGAVINAAFRPRYNVQFDSATSSSLLTINDVRLSDAGTYSCSKLSSRIKIAIIHLNVLATEPQCKTNMSSRHHSVSEVDLVTVDCDVRYRGRWAPVIGCRPRGQVLTNSITDDYRRYRQVIRASSLIHAQTILCTTVFTSPAPDFSSSTGFGDPPNRSYTWTSPTIRVVKSSTLESTYETVWLTTTIVVVVGIMAVCVVVVAITVVVVVLRKRRITSEPAVVPAASRDPNTLPQYRQGVGLPVPNVVNSPPSGNPGAVELEDHYYSDVVYPDQLQASEAVTADSVDTAVKSPYDHLGQVARCPAPPSVYLQLTDNVDVGSHGVPTSSQGCTRKRAVVTPSQPLGGDAEQPPDIVL